MDRLNRRRRLCGQFGQFCGSLGVPETKPPTKKPANCGPFRFLLATSALAADCMAVREGFEPSIRYRIHAFQASAFDHSATSPLRARIIPQGVLFSSPGPTNLPVADYCRVNLGKGFTAGSVLRKGLISKPPRRV